MNTLEYKGNVIEYQIEKSKRKTISIRVGACGVVVRAPRSISNVKINQLVLSKADWIVKKWIEMQEIEQENPIHQYVEGEEFLYQGERVELKLEVGRRSSVRLEWNQLILRCAPEAMFVKDTMDSTKIVEYRRQLLESWYREQARQQIGKRLEYYLQNNSFGKIPNRVTIKDQKSRWGSCSSKGNLNFNYRLIMAPPEVLDYVVVHELCHFLHMDHSADFWAKVGTVLPDYKQQRQWLKENGKILTL